MIRLLLATSCRHNRPVVILDLQLAMLRNTSFMQNNYIREIMIIFKMFLAYQNPSLYGTAA